MTQIPVAARAQKDIRFQIGEDNYEMHVSNVEWPDADEEKTWRGGTPTARVTDVVAGDDKCNITFIQAWDDPESLCVFMFNHAGEQADVLYKPHADAAFQLSATITIKRPAIGGKTGELNESTVACPSSRPLVVTPAP